MLYDTAKISEQCNISKLTAYVKLKLPEVKPLVISKNGKLFVDERGLELIKENLKLSRPEEIEVAGLEAELLKEDMIEVLRADNIFLKNQLMVKDEQFDSIKKLFENNQVLFQQEQEKLRNINELPDKIKEHDIELVNKLSSIMEAQRQRAKAEKQERKGLIKKIKGIFK